MTERVIELFAGYGGLGMGLSLVRPVSVVAVSEIDPAACKVLAARLPDVPNLGNITKIDFRPWRGVDWIIGGSPCQDVSLAGKRAGMVEGTRSGLWSQMARAISEARPRFVLWENVRGALNAAAGDVEPDPEDMGLDAVATRRAAATVVGDLAELGYDSRWGLVRAADAGAPHSRARLFVVAADADLTGSQGPEPAWGRNMPARGTLADAASHGWDQGRTEPAGHKRGSDVAERGGVDWGPYAEAIRRGEYLTGRAAPAPTEPGRNGPRLNARFVEWMMGLPAGWVTDVPGVARANQLKMLGNGAVPQQVALALASLISREDA